MDCTLGAERRGVVEPPRKYLHSYVALCIFLLSYAGIAQLVERNLAKVDVAGSNPVSRSVPWQRDRE
jgi:hypothetical protein